jgi:hypothetical protein
MIESDRDVYIFIDTPQFFKKPDSLSVYMQLEPVAVFDSIRIMKKDFDYVLRREALGPRDIQCLPAESWVPLSDTPKSFKISLLASSKEFTYGHTLRKLLYMNQGNFAGLPVTFWRSAMQPHLPKIFDNPIIPQDTKVHSHDGLNRSAKTAIFDGYQYSIVIENSREINYFSEKLLDCLLTKTVPIYFGCPNISDYFDTEGWILLTSSSFAELEAEALEKIRLLNESSYAKSPVDKNCALAHYFSSCAENVVRSLVQIPGIRRLE